MASTSAKVNEKSTKTDIWEAYQSLLGDLQQHPVSVSDDPAKLQKMTTALAEAKASLVGHFDATIERLGTLQQAYSDADQDLARRKNLVIEVIEQEKKQLEASIAAIRTQWEQEKTDLNLKRQRDDDAYTYELTRKRRDEQETYDQKTKVREQNLAERETAVVEREHTIADLTAEVEAFPAHLQEATKNAREELAKELKAECNDTVKDLKQASEHEKSILNLKLQSAEATINVQTKQVADIQRQLEASAAQLKEMAVAVIQSKSAPSLPSD
jgi:uncharacterized membrane-anchored protein YhcB (DUF1043 family)